MKKNNTNYEDLSTEVGEMLTRGRNTRTYNTILAKELNKSKAAMINQIHYWTQLLRDEHHFHDGRYWVHETYEDWQAQFPDMTTRGIQKMLLSLEEDGYIFVGNFNNKKYDRTKWYAVNYDKIKEVLEKNEQKTIDPHEQSSSAPHEQSSQWVHEQSSSPIPNISIPNNSIPNNPVLEGSNFGEDCPPTHRLRERLHNLYGDNYDFIEEMEEVINYFFEQYEEAEGRPHQYLRSDESFNKPTKNIGEVVELMGAEEGKDLVDRYFKSFRKRTGKGKLSYWHFGDWEILRKRAYEEQYGQSVVEGIFGEEPPKEEMPFEIYDYMTV